MPEALELDETKKSRFFVGCGAHEPFFFWAGEGLTKSRRKQKEKPLSISTCVVAWPTACMYSAVRPFLASSDDALNEWLVFSCHRRLGKKSVCRQFPPLTDLSRLATRHRSTSFYCKSSVCFSIVLFVVSWVLRRPLARVEFDPLKLLSYRRQGENKTKCTPVVDSHLETTLWILIEKAEEETII